MHISQLFVYPIKSLQGMNITSWDATRRGLKYDRRFMLVRQSDQKNMHLSDFPAMSLFATSIENLDESDKAIVRVCYKEDDEDSLKVPLNPNTKGLDGVEIDMHKSPTRAYAMGVPYDQWFSRRFGYDVIFVYLGESTREVLGNVYPRAVTDGQQQQQGLSSWLPKWAPTSVSSRINEQRRVYDGITFADCAPYLVVSEESMKNVNGRLPPGDKVDIVKFRPNIVLSGAEAEYEEDFWAELSIAGTEYLRLILTQNCGRCRSINVDYSLGEPGKTASGKILKKLMSDRRVDEGVKYSPIFGRYGFLDFGPEKVNARLEVGNEVKVLERNRERTKFEWPGLT